MTDIVITDVPDDVMETLRRHADVAGQSLEDYVRELLIRILQRPETITGFAHEDG